MKKEVLENCDMNIKNIYVEFYNKAFLIYEEVFKAYDVNYKIKNSEINIFIKKIFEFCMKFEPSDYVYLFHSIFHENVLYFLNKYTDVITIDYLVYSLEDFVDNPTYVFNCKLDYETVSLLQKEIFSNLDSNVISLLEYKIKSK